MVLDKALIKKFEHFGLKFRGHPTIIKYETLTPDMFLLCLLAVESDGSEQHLALLSYDKMRSLEHAQKVIRSNFAEVREFVPPVQDAEGQSELSQKEAYIEGMRYLLALTERPKGEGYWSTRMTIFPGDDIEQKLEGLAPGDKEHTKRLLVDVLRSNLSAATKSNAHDFLDSWLQTTERRRLPADRLKINDTNVAIHLYKNIIGDWEVFHSRGNSPS